jgi:hypothetical protein
MNPIGTVAAYLEYGPIPDPVGEAFPANRPDEPTLDIRITMTRRSRGTKDALLLSHAAAIERAAGDSAAAARHHAEALAINPYVR